MAVSPTTETPTPIPACAATGRLPPEEEEEVELSLGELLVVASCWFGATLTGVELVELVVVGDGVELVVTRVVGSAATDDDVDADEMADELLGRGASVMLK